MRRAFLTGFKGSAGTAVVTSDAAYLWTDSRYWNEASLQLDASCWQLQKAGLPDTPTIPKWLGELAAKQYSDTQQPLRVGMDPFVHAASFAKEVQDAFQEAGTQELDLESEEAGKIGVLETSHANLVDDVWGDERPPVPTSPFRVHPMEYAGMSIDDKVAKIRSEMKEKKATMAVFSTLDDVAYLFNVRAKGDVDTCPVGIAYASITHETVTLYCDPKKVEAADIKEHLKAVKLSLIHI